MRLGELGVTSSKANAKRNMLSLERKVVERDEVGNIKQMGEPVRASG